MNAPRVAAALRRLLEAGAELAEALEDEAPATPKPPKRPPRKYVVAGPEPTEIDRARAGRALRRAGLVGSGR